MTTSENLSGTAILILEDISEVAVFQRSKKSACAGALFNRVADL